LSITAVVLIEPEKFGDNGRFIKTFWRAIASHMSQEAREVDGVTEAITLPA